MLKLLQNLTGKNNRNAQFRTVIALIINGEEKLFNGIVKGTISTEKKGDSGFGYDPIFIPEGYTESFAQMSAEMKNSISHRFRATKQLSDYLKENYD
jgi:XTP/dITP diphosphohydrolase